MRRSRLTIAIVLALLGLVWLGQGTGLIGGSPMTGSPFWGIAGAAILVVALALVLIERRRPASS